MAIAAALACNVGDGDVPDFSSFGGTAVDGDDDGGNGDGADATAADGDGDADADGADSSTSMPVADDTAGADADDSMTGTTASQDGTTASDDASTTDGESTDDGGTTAAGSSGGESTGDETTGGESTGSESSSDGGVVPTDAYEPCNPDATCDQPGEVCLEVGSGGFCTQTCGNDAMCPDAPAGSTLTAGCEFLLGFPDFGSDYCGMIGCNFIFNDCPAGMTCTPVVMGLTVCEWV